MNTYNSIRVIAQNRKFIIH